MKEDFTRYDIKPEEFLNYLRYYGEHFNKKLCTFACSYLSKQDYNKDKLISLLQSYNIKVRPDRVYDAVFLINRLKSLFYGSGIDSEKQLVLLTKDILEKEGDLIFNRWYADCAKKGISIEWEDMI